MAIDISEVNRPGIVEAPTFAFSQIGGEFIVVGDEVWAIASTTWCNAKEITAAR